MSKPIFLCADDFGLHSSINAGILALAEQGRLSATSCMTLTHSFARDAASLRQTSIAAGLHLSLTESGASRMTALPLQKVIGRSVLRHWKKGELRKEIELQLDAFETHMQRPPSHVDGHQHIHALPQIREILLDILVKRYPKTPPVLRSTFAGADSCLSVGAFKGKVIQALGARGLKQLANKLGLPITHSLLGVYGFKSDASTYLLLLTGWMSCARPDDLIMCHPALGADTSDGLSTQRQIEFQVLSSAQLQNELHHMQAHIEPGVPQQPGKV